MLRARMPSFLFALLTSVGFAASANSVANYQPTAVFCSDTAHKGLCPVIPGTIGDDPPLKRLDYSGVLPPQPTSANDDVQSPFDNYSWQVFVALNWASGAPPGAARRGLDGELGVRVWETWDRVSQLFGPAPGLADCGPTPAGLERFDIGSDTKGSPVAENEEYIQAATVEPLIDVSGNWTIYERRVNPVEAGFLKAPYGNASWTLTTRDGQKKLVAEYSGSPKVFFPTLSPTQPNGAMEIKAAWRILDPAKHAENIRKYYVRRAFLTVPPDLVRDAKGAPGGKICARVDLGLVAIHILQKNPRDAGLQPQWIWSTFEHVDNAPLAQTPCDPAIPDQCQMGVTDCPPAPDVNKISYSYFDPHCPQCSTNQAPKQSAQKPYFAWNPKQPFALNYLRPLPKGPRFGSQVSRCWSIYAMTASLNTQWRAELRKAGSVFQNYMLVGSQWGFITVGRNPMQGFLPKYIANTLIETYLQRARVPAERSCMACHINATLPAQSVTSDFSFLSQLATEPGAPLIRQQLFQDTGGQ